MKFIGRLLPRKFASFAFPAIPSYALLLAVRCHVKFARFASREIEQVPCKFARFAFALLFFSCHSRQDMFIGSVLSPKFARFASQAIPSYAHPLAVRCHVKFACFASSRIKQVLRKFARFPSDNGIQVQSISLYGV